MEDLERHQKRREAGMPTVSLLVGRHGLCLGRWRRWCLESRFLPFVAGEAKPSELAEAWIREWLAAPDPLQRAARYVHLLSGRSPDALPDLAVKSDTDRRVWLENVLEASPPGTALSVAAHIIRSARRTGNELRISTQLPWPHRNIGIDLSDWVAGLSRIDGPSSPALILCLREAGARDSRSIDVAARALAGIAEAAPLIPLAWAVEEGTLDALIRDAADSRARAICLEGVVRVPSLADADIEGSVAGAARDTLRLTPTVRRLSADGADRRLVERFSEAVRAVDRVKAGIGRSHGLRPEDPCEPTPAEREGVERARSAAEAFLYERLETLPETSGLFALNRKVLLCGRELEVDLLSEERRIAVEIDGFFHFTDPEGYRRDRRKDFLLQQGGYLVLRFLTEDVVECLEAILGTIREALLWRAHGAPLGARAAGRVKGTSGRGGARTRGSAPWNGTG